MKRPRKIIGAALLALLLGLTVPGAEGATAWQGFGKAGSQGRGLFGHPYVSLTSTTKRHPTVVRLQFRDYGRTRTTNASWDIFCWNGNDLRTWSRGSNGKRSFPIDIKWDPPAWVDHCEVDGTAWHLQSGRLTINAQARYP